MQAQDINQIASAVVANLTGGDANLLGCGSISSAVEFDAEVYACTGAYECGGEAAFTCNEIFDCANEFFCPKPFSGDRCRAIESGFDCMDCFGPQG